MFSFGKKKTEFIPELIENHKFRDLFFYRIAVYDVISGRVIAYNSQSPEVVTFDPWPQVIFLEALGTRTVKEFILYMANSYKKDVPPGLEKTIIEHIESLSKGNMIALSTAPTQLDREYLEPRNKKI